MFDIDKWQEVLVTIRHNKLRTILTGFSVAWGIFILIILLGSGNGLENGVRNQFRGNALNSMFLWSGQMSKAYEGYKEGRFIKITTDDAEVTKRDNKAIAKLSSRFRIWGNNTVTYGKFYGNYELCNVNPDNQYIDEFTIVQGRYLNEVDIKELRKVAVIGKKAFNELFRGKPALGKYIKISSVPYLVVGVFDAKQDRDNNRIYMPITTSQMVFNQGKKVEDISFTVSNISADESQSLETEIRKQYSKRHHFDPDDKQALNIYNNFKEYNQFQTLFNSIQIFIWIIGIGTIIAGIVGVSNIMLIVVRERTREIGIRKAIGASPFSVVAQVMSEAIIITTVAGYVGLVLGVGLLEILRPLFNNVDSFFLNPEANFKVAVSATLILIISGTLAGLIPARRAASVKPIEALRDE
jgi:putative ABC transport system permease protein